jgi:hypothetical protein
MSALGLQSLRQWLQYPPDFVEKDRNARNGCQNYCEFYEPILLEAAAI